MTAKSSRWNSLISAVETTAGGSVGGAVGVNDVNRYGHRASDAPRLAATVSGGLVSAYAARADGVRN
mgnify:CR=1 FL=1